jgi:hypothetical protein
MRFCPNCGNPLGGSPRYCAGCASHVGPEDDPASAPSAQASPATPLHLPTPVPVWSFHDPAWATRHPFREPEGSPWANSAPPWANSAPPWADSYPPWANSAPPWADSYPPWAASGDPAAGDQAPAVSTLNPGASPPSSPPGTPEAARPDGHPRLFADRRPRLSLSPGHGTTITAMVTTVALLATGSVAAWEAGQMRSRLQATNTSLSTRRAAPDRPARTPGARPSGPDPSPASSPAAGSAAATSAVTITPAAASQPHVHRVVRLLDLYFSAINRHDFPAYSSLFIPAIRVSMHNFAAAYQSTRDSRARLTGLSSTGPLGLAARVTFVSHQNPADSPDHAACNRWHVTVFLKRDGHSYHIRRHQPGFPADRVQACR